MWKPHQTHCSNPACKRRMIENVFKVKGSDLEYCSRECLSMAESIPRSKKLDANIPRLLTPDELRGGTSQKSTEAEGESKPSKTNVGAVSKGGSLEGVDPVQVKHSEKLLIATLQKTPTGKWNVQMILDIFNFPQRSRRRAMRQAIRNLLASRMLKLKDHMIVLGK